MKKLGENNKKVKWMREWQKKKNPNKKEIK